VTKADGRTLKHRTLELIRRLGVKRVVEAGEARASQQVPWAVPHEHLPWVGKIQRGRMERVGGKHCGRPFLQTLSRNNAVETPGTPSRPRCRPARPETGTNAVRTHQPANRFLRLLWTARARSTAPGTDALASSPLQGSGSENQRQQVGRWILGQDPRRLGFDFRLWTRRIIHAFEKPKMGIKPGLTAVARLLASLDTTPQNAATPGLRSRPSRGRPAGWKSPAQDSGSVRARRGAMIFVPDEAGF
jgi:hypothetical protein